jgi:hypothetical protein
MMSHGNYRHNRGGNTMSNDKQLEIFFGLLASIITLIAIIIMAAMIVKFILIPVIRIIWL